MKIYNQINLGIFSKNQEIQKSSALGRAKKACFSILFLNYNGLVICKLDDSKIW